MNNIIQIIKPYKTIQKHLNFMIFKINHTILFGVRTDFTCLLLLHIMEHNIILCYNNYYELCGPITIIL